MFTHIPTGKTFENRKEAKKYFGLSEYNRQVKQHAFTFHDNREYKK